MKTPRLGGLALAGLGLLAAGGALAACGGGGSSARYPVDHIDAGPLKLTYMSANRKTNWDRNAPIEFWFSAPVSKHSLEAGIIDKAIQISIVTSKGRIPAEGSFSYSCSGGVPDKTKLIFDPTRSRENNKAPGECTASAACADNPFGFSALTTYNVEIPTPANSPKFLTAIDGEPIIQEFSSFFTTNEAYVREVEQPRYIGTDGNGALGFEPARYLSGEVPYNSRIQIVFDEAMDPNSFELGTTITIKNETLSAIQNQTVIVPGNFTSDVCGRTWKFVPSFSYGGAGYQIAVIMTSGMKDLAGNPLANPQTLRFRTEVKAGVPTTQVINESFDNQTFLDTANTTADWGPATAGVLTAGAVTTVQQIVALQPSQYPGGVRTRVRDHPFTNNAGLGHEQWIYLQSDLGIAAAITDVGWGPSSNALFASTHTQVKVRLGHTQGDSLSTTMDNNFDVGTPVLCADAVYTIPQRATIDPPCGTDACAVGYWPLPTFTNFFEYNGKNNLILDVDASTGTNYQITRIFFGPVGFPNRNTFAAYNTSAGTLVQPVVSDMRFTKKRRTTLAQSLFYDSGQNSPNYSPSILSPSTQAGGTSALLEVEGAQGILFPLPGNPNNVVPDPTTYTGFVTNLDQMDGYRFIRFRVTFIANVSTGQIPSLNSIAIPYIF